MLTKGGMPEIFTGGIVALDETSLLLCFAPKGSKDFLTLDFTGSAFCIGKRKLEAERGEEDIVSLEELD